MHFCITWVIFQPFRRRDVKSVAFLVIFHLRSNTFPLIPKLHGKMKQKLSYYEVELTPKIEFLLHLIRRIVIRCVITVDYGHFSCRHRPGIVFPKQNVYVNELNIFLLHASRSDEFKIVTRKWTKSGLYFTDILHVICTTWHLADEDCQC